MIITDKAQIKVASLKESDKLRLTTSDELECYELIESDLKLPADAIFTRSSIAYLSDGSQVPANIPRFEQGRFGKAIMMEEETTPKFLNGFFVMDSDADGLCDNWGKVYPVAGAVWSQINISGWGGKAQRCEITDTSYTPNQLGVSQSFIATAGNPISARMIGVTNKTTVWINLRDETNAVNFAFKSFSVTPGVPFDVSLSSTVPAGCTSVRVYFGCEKGSAWAVGDYIELYAAHVEEKPYSTSPTDVTRSSETLIIPTAGVLNPQEGTVECWVYVNDVVKTNTNRYIFAHATTTSSPYRNRFSLLNDTALRWTLVTSNVDGEESIIQVPDTTSIGWHYIAVTWKPEILKLFIDGVLVGLVENPKLPQSLADKIFIGSWVNGGITLNSLIDDLRISSRARTDEEIAAVYASGQPLPVDEWTTYKLDFDDKVRITTQGQIICNELIEI